MTSQQKATEEKILEAAKKVFINKGMVGARMQEIADEAGMNKALLHYYFRSKEKLFNKVFIDTFSTFFPKAETVFTSDKSIFDKIREFIRYYIDLLKEHPYIPQFILQELNRNPDSLYLIFKESKVNPSAAFNAFAKEVEKGTIKPIHPLHLMVNVLSMCIFPIAGRPLIEKIFFMGDVQEYDNFLEERKTLVADFVIAAIKA